MEQPWICPLVPFVGLKGNKLEFWMRGKVTFTFHSCTQLLTMPPCFRLCRLCGSRGVCASVWSWGWMLQHCFPQTGHWTHAKRWECVFFPKQPHNTFQVFSPASECLRMHFCRPAGTYDSCDDGRSDVFADVHLQQQLHALYHGHLEEALATSLWERAAAGWQVWHSCVNELEVDS